VEQVRLLTKDPASLFTLQPPEAQDTGKAVAPSGAVAIRRG